MHLGTVAAELLSEAIQQNIEHSKDWVKSYNEFRWAKYFKQEHDNKLGSFFLLRLQNLRDRAIYCPTI